MPNLSLPALFLSIYLFRPLYFGANIADALIILPLVTLYGVHCYLESKKEPEANIELKNRIVSLEEQMKATKDKVGSLSLAAPFLKR